MACIVRKRAGLFHHDCPNDKPDRPVFGCMCEYYVCLKHGQKAKTCTGKKRLFRVVVQ